MVIGQFTLFTDGLIGLPVLQEGVDGTVLAVCVISSDTINFTGGNQLVVSCSA